MQAWEDWEIPREAAPGWPAEATKLHAEWWAARIARQKKIETSEKVWRVICAATAGLADRG